jgi:hypothetical protein
VERDVSNDAPRLELGCVGRFACVVIIDALFEVGRDTDIALPLI